MAITDVELSVIIPAYNEGKVIGANVKALRQKLESLGTSYEVVIVNDGSTDDTQTQAQGCADASVHIVSYAHNRGKGHAVREGMKQARGKYKMFMDADMSTSLDEIEKFLITMRHYKFDILVGNRKIMPSLQEVKQPWSRRFFGTGYTILSSWTIGRHYTDVTCGLKMFQRHAAEIIFKRQCIDGWAFDTELMGIAKIHHLVVHEIPVVWGHKDGSKVRLAREIVTSIKELAHIRVNTWLRRYV